MDFFIKDDNVRPGNRGGRDQFKWDDVRMMNNKDRESYLGVSQSIGFLDKGGKWRKRDWWQSCKPEKITKAELSIWEEEKQKIKREEAQLLEDTINGVIPNNKKIKEKDKNWTDFQWERLTKREGVKIKEANDNKWYEFYQDDKHRRGWGVETNVSYRRNIKEKGDDMSKLKGEVPEDTLIEKSKINAVKDDNEVKDSKNSLLGKYIKEYVKEKRKRSRSRDDRSSEKDNSSQNNHRHHHRHRHRHSHHRKKDYSYKD